MCGDKLGAAGLQALAGGEAPGRLTVEDFTLRPGHAPTGTGISVLSGVPVALERFDLSGVTIGLEATATVKASSGIMTDCGVGLLPSDDVDLSEITAGVRLDCDRLLDPGN